MDAKYRDIWERGLPAEWLYQLSICALAAPARASVTLYGSMAVEPRDEQIDLREPARWSSKGPASVILRPVPLLQLAELLDPDRARNLTAERRRWAVDLVALQARKPAETTPGRNVQVA